MKKPAFKKMIALMLALLISCIPLGACSLGKPAGPLRILLDVSDRTMYSNTSYVFDKLLEEIAAEGGPADVEVEYLPRTGVERETAITRLRTEIMAGDGPDLFIISSCYWWDGESPDDIPLFPMPEKSMYNGLFMPLDKYMEKAKFAQWGDFNQTVMEVGQTDKGQVLVPLSYTFPVTCFRRTEANHEPSKDLTWDDMLADGSLIMKAAAVLQGGSDENQIGGFGNPNFDAVFGKVADYKAEELLFTQEEFAEYAYKQLELYKEESWAGLEQLPEYFHTYARPWYYTYGDRMGGVPPYIRSGEDLTVIPQYNKDGGVTATVFHYACVNAGSKRGEDAFFVLDYLLGRGAVRADVATAEGGSYTQAQADWRQDFYSLFFGSNGVPIDQGVEYFNVHEGVISAHNRTALELAEHCITAVNIHGKLNKQMAWMMSQCETIQSGYEEGNIEALIAETYRVMQMELQEG
ncbi:ABC transporter substrate-binding protein [Acutalibacter caecimuris]|uniref:ABC transporter substrate-binding protein n=1 Tax=Acutalibacter caecimuris TaxID=3093657 RepID=UPI002AC9096F|nr:ABC transporter substrate-binding protein [Acutalibacter sp. M00118]